MIEFHIECTICVHELKKCIIGIVTKGWEAHQNVTLIQNILTMQATYMRHLTRTYCRQAQASELDT